MSHCKQIRRPSRKVCVGDMNVEIALIGRDIVPPVSGEAEFSEAFDTVEASTSFWASVETADGSEYFDGLNVLRGTHTHTVYIRYDSTVTAETWVQFGDERRLDILDVENLDERSRFQRLICSERGDKDLGGAHL